MSPTLNNPGVGVLRSVSSRAVAEPVGADATKFPPPWFKAREPDRVIEHTALAEEHLALLLRDELAQEHRKLPPLG